MKARQPVRRRDFLKTSGSFKLLAMDLHTPSPLPGRQKTAAAGQTRPGQLQRLLKEMEDKGTSFGACPEGRRVSSFLVKAIRARNVLEIGTRTVFRHLDRTGAGGNGAG